jgi:hypothetical protein
VNWFGFGVGGGNSGVSVALRRGVIGSLSNIRDGHQRTCNLGQRSDVAGIIYSVKYTEQTVFERVAVFDLIDMIIDKLSMETEVDCFYSIIVLNLTPRALEAEALSFNRRVSMHMHESLGHLPAPPALARDIGTLESAELTRNGSPLAW